MICDLAEWLKEHTRLRERQKQQKLVHFRLILKMIITENAHNIKLIRSHDTNVSLEITSSYQAYGPTRPCI